MKLLVAVLVSLLAWSTVAMSFDAPTEGPYLITIAALHRGPASPPHRARPEFASIGLSVCVVAAAGALVRPSPGTVITFSQLSMQHAILRC